MPKISTAHLEKYSTQVLTDEEFNVAIEKRKTESEFFKRVNIALRRAEHYFQPDSAARTIQEENSNLWKLRKAEIQILREYLVAAKIIYRIPTDEENDASVDFYDDLDLYQCCRNIVENTSRPLLIFTQVKGRIEFFPAYNLFIDDLEDILNEVNAGQLKGYLDYIFLKKIKDKHITTSQNSIHHLLSENKRLRIENLSLLSESRELREENARHLSGEEILAKNAQIHHLQVTLSESISQLKIEWQLEKQQMALQREAEKKQMETERESMLRVFDKQMQALQQKEEEMNVLIKRAGGEERIKMMSENYDEYKASSSKFKTILSSRTKESQFPFDTESYKTSLNPELILCPITHEIMIDPVIASDGFTYERKDIEKWLSTKNTSPSTNEILADKTLKPNITLKSIIEDYIVKKSENLNSVDSVSQSQPSVMLSM